MQCSLQRRSNSWLVKTEFWPIRMKPLPGLISGWREVADSAAGKVVFLGRLIQRASEASEADYQSCSIEISDIYIYIICRYVCVRQKISPALLIT